MREERETLQMIDERDDAIEWADRLAALLAPPRIRGEHSNANDPWRNAVEYAQDLLRGRGIASFVEEAGDYELLRDHIIDKLNPLDDDAAETHILCTAIDRAAEFIEAQPCTCEPGAYNYGDSCDRCYALMRRENKRMDVA